MFSQPRRTDGQAAIITLFELDRVAVQAGESVTVRWRTANAGTMRITMADGYSVDLDASTGAGSHEFTVRTAGTIRATAYGWVGAPAQVSRMIGLFSEPELVYVPVPELRDAPLPVVFGRTALPIMDRSSTVAPLVSTPPVRLRQPNWTAPPAQLLSIMPIRSTGVTRGRGRSWFSLGDQTARPIDVLALFMGRGTSRRRPPRWLIRRRRRGADL